jgi:hypothetical protein
MSEQTFSVAITRGKAVKPGSSEQRSLQGLGFAAFYVGAMVMRVAAVAVVMVKNGLKPGGPRAVAPVQWLSGVSLYLCPHRCLRAQCRPL